MRKSWKAACQAAQADVAALREVLDWCRLPLFIQVNRWQEIMDREPDYASAFVINLHHLAGVEAIRTAEHPAEALAEFEARWQAERKGRVR